MHMFARAFILLLLPFAAAAQSSSTIISLAPAAGDSTITPTQGKPSSTEAPTSNTPATAPVRQQPAPISAEALKEAKMLTEVLGVPLQAKTLMSQVRDQVIAATISASGKSPAEAAAIADELMMPEFTSHEADLVNLLTVPWALGFTPDEMRDLRAFYLTPLGKRVLAAMPKVTQQSIQVGQEWMQKNFREAVTKHSDELKSRGLKF